MIKKILFQTLQRLDLADANELQQGVLDKIKKVITAMRPYRSDIQGSLVGYPVENVTVQGVANGIVTFNPFSCISAEDEVIAFDSTDVTNGLTQCDITDVISNYVTQTNNGEVISGIYFYAYPTFEDGQNENREFYSVIDDAPITQNVATRRLSKLTFFANFDASYRVTQGSYQPIALGYVASGNINTANQGSPFLTSNFISYNYFDEAYGNSRSWDDNSLPNVLNDRHTSLSTDFNPGTLVNGNGLNSPFARMERDIQRIMSFGTDDRTDTDLINVNGKPKYSLQGLKKEIEKVDETVKQDLTVHLDTVILEPIYSDAWTALVGTSDQATARNTIILNQETPFRILGYETSTLTALTRDTVTLGPTGDGLNYNIGSAHNYQILIPLASGVSINQIKSMTIEGAGTSTNDQRGRYPSGIFGSLQSCLASPQGNYYPWNSSTSTPGVIFQTSLAEIGIFHNQVVEYFRDNDGEYAAPAFRLLVKVYGRASQ
jgi:hypothetical protein